MLSKFIYYLFQKIEDRISSCGADDIPITFCRFKLLKFKTKSVLLFPYFRNYVTNLVQKVL